MVEYGKDGLLLTLKKYTKKEEWPSMLKGLYLMIKSRFDDVYNENIRKEIEKIVDIYAPPQTAESIKANPGILKEADVIFGSWGMPKLDEQFLANAPNLKIVFYAAGSVKYFVTDESWKRGVRVTTAYAANSVPVAEFTLAQIILSLKRVWYFIDKLKSKKVWESEWVPGCYRTTVGIVSLGMIGRMVCERLKTLDVDVIAYSTSANKQTEKELGIRFCSLEEVFSTADVISLHTPWLKETENMINGRLFRMMKKHATFINTARGAVVNEKEMIEVLKERPDIYVLLDVTYPEPPVKGSPLYELPNVILTPHIAGSLNAECGRMAEYMLEELKLYVAGQPLKWELTKEQVEKMA